MFKKKYFELPTEVKGFCHKVESYMGILDEELTKKVREEYNKYFTVYNLEHHSTNNLLIRLRTLGLINKCKCLTPDNLNRLFVNGIGRMEFPNPHLYPVLPLENISRVAEAFDLIKGYYTDKELINDRYKEEIYQSLKLDFYGDWYGMLNMSEEESTMFWIKKLKILIKLEPNEQNQVTMRNIIIRRYPNLEAYESYLLE